jgi:thymidylate synthase (FAD)
MQVLDKGEVTLIQHLATDLSVVAAARVSNGAQWENASKGNDGDTRLINFLAEHDHGTPFEHNLFTFYIKAPIFVVREWHRHRIGWSYNEISGRYVDFGEPQFYVPAEARIPAIKNKQGSVVTENSVLTKVMRARMEDSYFEATRAYRDLLDRGVARELARAVLPVGMYTQMYASCNARSLAHFLRLRTTSDAQWEIRQYANALDHIFKETMPTAWRALRGQER